jgi:hypothetical protein
MSNVTLLTVRWQSQAASNCACHTLDCDNALEILSFAETIYVQRENQRHECFPIFPIGAFGTQAFGTSVLSVNHRT